MKKHEQAPVLPQSELGEEGINGEATVADDLKRMLAKVLASAVLNIKPQQAAAQQGQPATLQGPNSSNDLYKPLMGRKRGTRLLLRPDVLQPFSKIPHFQLGHFPSIRSTTTEMTQLRNVMDPHAAAQLLPLVYDGLCHRAVRQHPSADRRAAADPARAAAVQNWLDTRPLPPATAPKEHAWSYMAGWYAEHGCEAFYSNLWHDPRMVAELEAHLRSSGAWQIAVTLAG